MPSRRLQYFGQGGHETLVQVAPFDSALATFGEQSPRERGLPESQVEARGRYGTHVLRVRLYFTQIEVPCSRSGWLPVGGDRTEAHSAARMARARTGTRTASPGRTTTASPVLGRRFGARPRVGSWAPPVAGTEEGSDAEFGERGVREQCSAAGCTPACVSRTPRVRPRGFGPFSFELLTGLVVARGRAVRRLAERVAVV